MSGLRLPIALRAVGGSVPARAVRSDAETKGKKKVTCYRVAIIGTGAIAAAHMRALNAMGDRVQVVAGVDIDRSRVEAYCAEHGIPRAYTDAGAMLAAEQPDLVHIATPPGTHHDLIMAGLDAGAWVW